ncbi:hypothetical protein EG028_11025 [Chitinophaga barathri]|uniref:Beta-lactamase-inhibitor-like PepSY-like domain-containing protein n=2 Tax=Chitinophaga barathri TaxID=1647451 RepID=A0A3N4MBU5_9BACT|nr:hypothetical protein EG028_11025 [Chitinophaga barathri]
MKQLTVLIFCSCLFLACNQVSRSVQETFHPTDTPVLAKPAVTTIPTPIQFPTNQAQTVTSATITIETHTSTTTHTHRHTEGKNVRFLTDGNRLNKAEEALKKLPQYAGKEIFIYSSIHFYKDGSIHALLRHPENPDYIDKYIYRNGAWSAPKPEQVTNKDRIRTRLISLDRIRFSNAAKVARALQEKTREVEGAKPVTSVYISIWDNGMRWFPSTINGSRDRYSLQFSEDGELKKFELE